MDIKNVIAECGAPNAKRLQALAHIVVHYTSLAKFEPVRNEHPTPDAELTAKSLVDAFCRGTMSTYTGGLAPYHLLVGIDGTVEQMLPLRTRGAHVPGQNWCSLAVAYVGEDALPSLAQRSVLVDVLRDLLIWAGSDVSIIGHTELVAKAGGALCPHHDLSVGQLAVDAAIHLPSEWRQWSRHARDTTAVCNGYQVEPETAAPQAA